MRAFIARSWIITTDTACYGGFTKYALACIQIIAKITHQAIGVTKADLASSDRYLAELAWISIQVIARLAMGADWSRCTKWTTDQIRPTEVALGHIQIVAIKTVNTCARISAQLASFDRIHAQLAVSCIENIPRPACNTCISIITWTASIWTHQATPIVIIVAIFTYIALS